MQIPTGDENSSFQRGVYEVFFFFLEISDLQMREDLEIDCFLTLTPLQNCSVEEELPRKEA